MNSTSLNTEIQINTALTVFQTFGVYGGIIILVLFFFLKNGGMKVLVGFCQSCLIRRNEKKEDELQEIIDDRIEEIIADKIEDVVEDAVDEIVDEIRKTSPKKKKKTKK